jgi:hypothetical protein
VTKEVQRIALVVLAGCGRIGFDPAALPSCALVATPATSPEYFMSPTGSDAADGTTPATAWATFGHAWTVIGPGATLTLLDGVYREDMRPSISGTPDAPILVRALHDGAAIVDGENLHMACDIAGDATTHVTDFIVEGLYCRDPIETAAGGEVPVLAYFADRITIRRVTAHGVHDGVFLAETATDVVFEDIAAYGGGLNMVSVAGSSNVVIRRAYAHWVTGSGDASIFSVFDSNGVIIEDAIAVTAETTFAIGGFDVLTGMAPADDTVFVNAIARGPMSDAFVVSWTLAGDVLPAHGTTARDIAVIGSPFAFYQRADSALTITQATFAGPGTEFAAQPVAGGQAKIGFSLSSSALALGTIGIDIALDPNIIAADHHDNVLFSLAMPYAEVATAGAGEQMFDPGWDTARYGDGGYLVRPPALATAGENGGPAGAEILYRSVNGVVTDVPLWPWPLEDRIAAEDGTSVTWETGGGIWRTAPPVACP